MPKRARVNIKTKVNASDIKREKRDGRDVIVVPSATLPDNVVMNNVMYPADEIAKSFHTLENTLAPLGHPTISGRYVSALHPGALAGFYFGAHNENVRREGGRVFLDKVIDVARAQESEKGRALLNAIDKGQPIHTSTGVLVNMKPANHPDYSHVATDMYFDHDAILLNEPGAATPEQGVGMLVNADGTTEEVDVMDVEIDEKTMEDIADSIAHSIAWRVEEEEREKRLAPIIDVVVKALKSVLKGNKAKPAAGHNPPDSEDEPMPVTEEQFNELKGQVTTLSANLANIGNTVAEAVAAAIKPVTDSVNVLTTNAKVAEDAERNTLVQKVVKANLLSEETAKTMAINALRELADKIQPAAAAPIFGGLLTTNNDEQIASGSFLDNIKAAGGDK